MRISDWSSDVCSSDLGPVLPFGVGPIDHLLAAGGLDGAGLHEVAAASASWSDDAATTLFAAGIAARFAAAPGVSALWALTRFDLYRSEEHTSELQSLMRISYAVFCLKKKNTR